MNTPDYKPLAQKLLASTTNPDMTLGESEAITTELLSWSQAWCNALRPYAEFEFTQEAHEQIKLLSSALGICLLMPNPTQEQVAQLAGIVTMILSATYVKGRLDAQGLIRNHRMN